MHISVFQPTVLFEIVIDAEAMNHKDNRRVKLTKQLLKDSLCGLLEQKSIHEISVRTLCENADINRSTFYKYYGSLYDLLKEMEDDFLIGRISCFMEAIK